MSERPNDTPDGPIDEPGGEPPIDDEAIDVEGEDAPESEAMDADLDETGASDADEASDARAATTQDEAAAKAAEADVHRERGLGPSERRAARAAERSQITIDPSLRIKDRASALFVLVTVGLFGLILLNGIVLGTGGLLNPLPTFSIPTLAPTTAPTAAPTAPPTQAPTPAPTATPAAS
jgi:cell division septation protein DedD